jgi:dihydrofolate reductase
MLLGLEGGIQGFPTFKEYIFSTTLDKVKEGAILIKGNIRDEVEKIKKQKGKDIWLFGGASLTTSLMNMGLVDELWLSVHPLILGSGKPLFQNMEGSIPLTLLDSKTYSTGLVSLVYAIKNRG